MAYRFTRDKEDMIHFEHGKWDSFWGYICFNCGRAFGDTEDAYQHDTEQPCKDPIWCRNNRFTWSGKISIPAYSEERRDDA